MIQFVPFAIYLEIKVLKGMLFGEGCTLKKGCFELRTAKTAESPPIASNFSSLGLLTINLTELSLNCYIITSPNNRKHQECRHC